MKLLLVIAFVSVLFSAYVVWGRPWLRKAEWAKPFFTFIEPVEIALWWKSETIFKARAKMALGVLLTFLAQIGTLDLTPIMPFVPDEYEPTLRALFNLLPMILTVGGWVDEKLRKDTTKPLEVVAIPEAAPPEVKLAAVKAEIANERAVAAVETAAKAA
jgi:hypothetical protein